MNHDDNEIVLEDESKFWITMTNPCIQTDSIVRPVKFTDSLTTGIDDLLFTINGATGASTINIPFLHDIASDAYGYGTITTSGSYSQDNPYHICGQKTYEIYMED